MAGRVLVVSVGPWRTARKKGSSPKKGGGLGGMFCCVGSTVAEPGDMGAVEADEMERFLREAGETRVEVVLPSHGGGGGGADNLAADLPAPAAELQPPVVVCVDRDMLLSQECLGKVAQLLAAGCIVIPVLLPGCDEGDSWHKGTGLEGIAWDNVVDFRNELNWGQCVKGEVLPKVELARRTLPKSKSFVFWHQIMYRGRLEQELREGLLGETKEETELRIKTAFNKLSVDGHIGPDQLKMSLEEIQVQATDEEVRDMIREADSTHTGTIEFQDFSRLLLRLMEGRPPQGVTPPSKSTAHLNSAPLTEGGVGGGGNPHSGQVGA